MEVHNHSSERAGPNLLVTKKIKQMAAVGLSEGDSPVPIPSNNWNEKRRAKLIRDKISSLGMNLCVSMP